MDEAVSNRSGPAAIGAGVVVGRDAELRMLDDLLSRAGSGPPATTVIRGEAGAGKSLLLEAIARRATAEGWKVLTAQGVESEAALPGAGLLSLLSRLRDHLGAVPEPQAQALSAALGWGPATASRDPFLVGAATLSLLSQAATHGPLLIAVDDAQWLDPESAEALTFAARRLGDDRVAVVATHRRGSPLPVRLDDFEVIPLSGLTAPAARTLLGPGFSADVVERLLAVTGGNPLALTECRTALSRAQRAGAAPLPPVLPVPARLREVYAVEVARLSTTARRAVVLAAVSSDQEAAPVLAALASEGLDAGACLADLEDMLELREGLLRFRHPLLRSVAWECASSAERRSAHGSLATTVRDRWARAWHRAEATVGLDAELAEELADVAEMNRSRLGFAAASRMLERAARLTPEGARRASWLATAADDAHVAGDAERARRLAAEVLTGDVGDDARARARFTLGVLAWSYESLARAREWFEQAAASATGRLRVRALCELFLACHLLDDDDGMAAAAARALEVADVDDPEQAVGAAYLTGAAHVVSGRPDLGAPLLRQAIEHLESDPLLRDDPRHLVVSLLCARWLMDPTAGLGYAERRLQAAREAGAIGVLATGLSLASGGLAWMGDHVRAHAFAGEAVELVDALGGTTDPAGAYEVAAMESACRGLHADAQRLLARARSNVLRNGFDAMPPHLARTVALSAMCRGDLAEVVEVLEDQLVRFNGVGDYLEPLGVTPLLVEAYLGLGRETEARHLAVRFRDAQPEQSYPAVAAAVARCEGLVATDLDEARAAFERSLELHELQPDTFERARTRLLYGMRLRRAGQRTEARIQLRTARRDFLAMDLTLWADRASLELRATGEQSRSRDATDEPLTSQETRVAVLAARGLTNREVAAALFLSPKTVERHLGAVLRKRGLRSRTELARALALDADSTSSSTGPA